MAHESFNLKMVVTRWLPGLTLALLSLVVHAQMSSGSESTNRMVDGELRACQAVSVDQAWAVGDHGVILATIDAGKTWTTQHEPSKHTYYAVSFSDLTRGWIAGGTLDPNTGASSGVILATANGGNTWSPQVSNLPRLTGLQLLGPNHLLAWGDWSNLYQSSLFESIDGGKTWASRPVPCSHLQAAATGNDGTLILVDRVGKVYRTQDGLAFDEVSFPVRPFERFRFCKQLNGVWWLGGEAGQLYRSFDSIQWTKLSLPGTPSDHAQFSLRDLSSAGARTWLVGGPGNVVWVTEDRGDTWLIRKTGIPTTNHSICAFNNDVVMMCGSLASIRATRNGGKAWWAQHQSGSRVSVLNIASSCSSVAWEILAQVSMEAKRSTSALVLHDQLLENRIGIAPDLPSRLEAAGTYCGATNARLLAKFPVGYLLHGTRPADTLYYAARNGSRVEQASSAMLRELVLELRSNRPDVIVTDCPETGTELERLSANAVDAAIQMASDSSFKLFSAASEIPEEPWQPKRIVHRGTRAGLVYSPAMLFKSSGTVLGQTMLAIDRVLALPLNAGEPKTPMAYRVAGSKSGTMRDPLDGIHNDPTTQLNDRKKPALRLNTMMAACQLHDWREVLSSESSSQLITDRVWESKLKEIVKDAPVESASQALVEIAIQSRRSGDWQRWHSALDQAISTAQTTTALEAALWELMSYMGSVEVKQVIHSQVRLLEERTADEKETSVATIQQASPFARPDRDADGVQPVSFQSAVRRVPIATSKDLNEFSRLLGRWPAELQERRSEPHWGWLITSRYRMMQQRNDETLKGLNLERSPSVFWPLLTNHIPTWGQVAAGERWISNAQASTNVRASNPLQDSPIRRCEWTADRPFLDGKADEVFWANAMSIELRDARLPDPAFSTRVKIARDSEFLFLFSESPFLDIQATRNSTDSDRSMLVSHGARSRLTDRKSKLRDSVLPNSDQVRIRFDLDRDYATWFEFAWSSDGEKTDSCNDMFCWDPSWYVAIAHSDTAWFAEIAIPLSELTGVNATSTMDNRNDVWAINAQRSVPSIGSQSIAPSISDQMACDAWTLVDVSVPAEKTSR